MKVPSHGSARAPTPTPDHVVCGEWGLGPSKPEINLNDKFTRHRQAEKNVRGECSAREVISTGAANANFCLK